MSNAAVEIYFEDTPNPESLKLVTNVHLLPNFQIDFRSAEMAQESELARMFFAIPFVKAVFIANNFVTITKHPQYDWFEIRNELRDALRGFIQSGRKAVNEVLLPKDAQQQSGNETAYDPESKIRDLLEKYVKPAVANDGGFIEFRSFENGVVTLSMQGACSGCPSSQVTLKAGIEGLLKRMVPEVESVVAEAE